MKKILFLIWMIILILPFSSFAQVPQPDHVVILILENHAYNQIIGSKAAPYINSLLKDKNCALFTNSYAIMHPSQPNYLAIFAGSNFGIDNDDRPINFPFTYPNLGAELLSHHLTFAGYSENLPEPGFNGDISGNYARRHNPWVNWQNAKSNGIPADLNLPFKYFPKNYNKLPAVSFVIPNVKNDMHDGKDPERIEQSDKWIKKNLKGYIDWAKKHNCLFVLTFDEDNDLEGNHIPTLFLGKMVKGGNYNEKVNHYNLLRTVEEMYHLPFAGESKSSAAIKDCWITK